MQLKTLLPAALAVAASAQSSSDMSLTDLLSSHSNLSSLTTLLGAYPDLTSTLASAENITILAPSNMALQALNSSMNSMMRPASMSDYIQSLLMYHVLDGEIYASQIMETPVFAPTLLNDTTYSNVTGGQVVEVLLQSGSPEVVSGLLQISNITQANLNYTNGVVHVIDEFLIIPQNISSTASAANLTAFLGALNATDLIDTANSLSDVTFFVPNNDAFQAIGGGLDSLSTSDLASILQYHVVNGTVGYSSALSDGMNLTTLAGEDLTITISNGNIFVNNAMVTTPNALISGGVFHVIDSVLNPMNATAASNSSSSNNNNDDSDNNNFGTQLSSATYAPFTSLVPAATTTIVAIQTTGGGAAGGAGSTASSSSSGLAPGATGAIGAAALFGGAAFLANM